jgi:hypothetical protein
VLSCPFCGAEETDRFEVDGARFLVFRCMFTPRVDPKLTDPEIAEEFVRVYKDRAPAYFQGMCDRLHLYVTKGDGARRLLEGRGADTSVP